MNSLFSVVAAHSFDLGHTFLLLDDYIRTNGKEGFFLVYLLALTCQHISWNLLLQDSISYTRPAETPSFVALSNN